MCVLLYLHLYVYFSLTALAVMTTQRGPHTQNEMERYEQRKGRKRETEHVHKVLLVSPLPPSSSLVFVLTCKVCQHGG